MNAKTIGIVLAALWVAAIVWIVAVLDDDAPVSDGGEAPGAVEVPDAPADAPADEPSPGDGEPELAGPTPPPSAGTEAPPPAGVEPPAVVDAPGADDEDADEDLVEALGDPDEHERRILRKIFEPLERASERYAKHEDLDESTFFGEDQESNQAAIDRLLDEAIETLGLSAINDTRQRLREIREEIEASEEQLSRDREARLSAPYENELNALEEQFTTTREDLDARIADNEERIAKLERERTDLEETFVDELDAIGLDLDRETARGLLSTVSGEDFVEMCVVFHNVRLVTVRLQQLTEEAGESLDVARRYYGSYVVLVRILDHIQKDFVARVRNEQVPKLAQFGERARENIEQARANLETGGDPRIVEQNIESNQLTLDACLAYRRYLLEQADAVEAQNEALQPRLRDAINTFETVQLSSQVANAIREARRNFAALLELDVPDLRGFENVQLRQEFERLTDQLLEP